MSQRFSILGTMKDYVQCCECGHESARDDSFLDIPITIRPFGLNKTYKSVVSVGKSDCARSDLHHTRSISLKSVTGSIFAT